MNLRLRTLLLLPLLTLALFPASAQTFIDPSRAAANLNDPAPPNLSIDEARKAASAGLEEENAFAPGTPGDSDIGQQVILKRNDDIQPFRVWLSASALWTDNAANTSRGDVDDWFLYSSVGAGWQQHLGNRFYADASAAQTWVRYDQFDSLDYELGEANAGLLIVMPELAHSILHVHYQYQRITQDIGDSAIYEAHNLRAGIQKTILINRLNSTSLGFQTILGFDTDPDLLQRHEYALNLGHNFKITRELILNFAYRLTWFDYFNLQGREDWYQNFGINLTWSPLKVLDLSASYNFALNRSNYDFFDYDTQLAGPSLLLKFKF